VKPSPGIIASPFAVSRFSRMTRGGLTATLATTSASASHSAVGHQLPHWLVVCLALAIAWPLCVRLSSTRLSRTRLGIAVLTSQTVFHGLFEIYPARGSATTADSTGHAMHHHGPSTVDVAHADVLTQVLPDTSMLLGHVLAGALTYAVIRRSELTLHAIALLLALRPALMLVLLPVPLRSPRAISAPGSFTTATIACDVWLGGSAQTLRGPPAFAG